MDSKNEDMKLKLAKANQIKDWITRQHPGARIQIEEGISEHFGHKVAKIILQKEEFSKSEIMQMEIDINRCFEPSMDIEIVFG